MLIISSDICYFSRCIYKHKFCCDLSSVCCLLVLQHSDSALDRRSEEVTQLHKIAGQSSGSEFDYFKHTLLQPFLVERLPGTEGNRLVQQASAVLVIDNNGWLREKYKIFLDQTDYLNSKLPVKFNLWAQICKISELEISELEFFWKN